MSGAIAAVHTDDAIRARFREIIKRATDCRTGKFLAYLAGFSPAAVRAWRQGRRDPIDPRIIDLLAACEELETAVVELVAERRRKLGK